MDDSHLPPTLERHLGDYELFELLSQGPLTRTFRAMQRSVNRQVLLDELREEAATPLVIDQFFADVRAKAAIDHPLIASIYEAVSNPTAHFYTREHLAGRSLIELLDGGTRLTPLEMARLLKHVADANLYLQTRGINAVPLAPEHVFVENDGLTRLVNVAVAGSRSPLAHVADTQMLGHILEDLIREDAEGATRVRTLLSWMADLERPLPLTWEQIQSYAEQVEQQLTAPTQTLPPAPTRQGNAAPKSQTPLVLGILAAAAVAVGLAVIISRNDNPKVPQERDLSATISVPQGSYATMDGASAQLPAFQLDAFEVSIGEYRKFLDQLSALPDGQRNAYDHPEQPASKLNHHPDGWDEMLAAAVAGTPWRDQLIDLNFPVVLVDWWDAYAFARWQQGRLPTQNEWFAAVTQRGGPPTLEPSGFGPVDADTLDITPAGIHGMAGNVAEWTGENELNPSVPMNPRSPMVIGGSFRIAGAGVNTREWVESRSLRRDDLGFRVAYEPR